MFCLSIPRFPNRQVSTHRQKHSSEDRTLRRKIPAVQLKSVLRATRPSAHPLVRCYNNNNITIIIRVVVVVVTTINIITMR